MLCISLVPLFGLLDYVITSSENHRLFWWLRFAVTGICLLQLISLRFTPDRALNIHAFLTSIVVGGMISYMTTRLGGFTSAYYSGLHLVIVGVNLALPWRARFSSFNSLLVISLYLGLNFWLEPESAGAYMKIALENLFFLGSMAIIAVTMGRHGYKLTRAEFESRSALWGEMEIAKKIQTALLPLRKELPGYELTSLMEPASEVGGDYYDFIKPSRKEIGWVAMGDVSGHGVSSGLIMMMAQTAIQTVVEREPEIAPSLMLSEVNSVLKENISRMGESRHMTLIALCIRGNSIRAAGKHQDIIVYRKRDDSLEIIKTRGVWLGILKDISGAFEDIDIEMSSGDVILLFTDGITERLNAEGEMYGIDRLLNVFRTRAGGGSLERCLIAIREDIARFSDQEFDDDVSIVLLRRK